MTKRRPGRPRGTTRGGSHVVSIRVNDAQLAWLTSGGDTASAVPWWTLVLVLPPWYGWVQWRPTTVTA